MCITQKLWPVGPVVVALASWLAGGCSVDDHGFRAALPSTVQPPSSGSRPVRSTRDAGPIEAGVEVESSADAPGDSGIVDVDEGSDPDAGPGDTGDTGDTGDAEPAQVLLWLPLDEGPGATAAQDHSGLDQRVTLHRKGTRPTWVAGRKGGALDLAGDAYLRVASGGKLDRPGAGFTAMMWLWRPRADADGVLISRGSVAAGGYCYRLRIDGNRLEVQLNTGSPVALVRPLPMALPVQRWVHVAFSYDGQQLRLYLDGQQVDRLAYSAPLAAGRRLTPILIGASDSPQDTDGVRDRLSGRIDDLAMFDRALDPAAVARLHTDHDLDDVTP